MRKVISKRLKQPAKPTLEALSKRLTEAVTNLGLAFQKDSTIDVATAEAEIRALEAQIRKQTEEAQKSRARQKIAGQKRQ